MHVTSPSAVRRLAASTPVVYAIFDLLYLDGHSLMELPYRERRARLEELGLSGRAWRVPAAHRGGGARLLEATSAQGLEGIVAKRLDSRYEPGRRTGAWIKIKHTTRQELVIGGWLPGEGRRAERIGALLMGYYEDGALSLRRARRHRLHRADARRARAAAGAAAPRAERRSLRARSSRATRVRRAGLVAEIEFSEWTADGVMRAPSFKGLREDKAPREVSRESGRRGRAGAGGRAATRPRRCSTRCERLPEGALAVLTDGRRLKLSNWDKVLFPQTRLHEGRPDRLLRADRAGGAARTCATAR